MVAVDYDGIILKKKIEAFILAKYKYCVQVQN